MKLLVAVLVPHKGRVYDPRWHYGRPPAGNANTAWLQHHPLEAPARRPGRCGGGDGGPAQPDGRQLGSITSRINRKLTPPDIDRIAGSVHAWRQDGEVAEAYADVPGFCDSAKLEEIEKKRFEALLKQQQQQEGAKLDQQIAHGPAALNHLEKEGVIRRFEYCFELAWKTTKDYMEANGFVFAVVMPRQVLKDAYAAKVTDEGQVWMAMLDHRNLFSHSYNPMVFEQAVEAIQQSYLPALERLHAFLQQEVLR